MTIFTQCGEKDMRFIFNKKKRGLIPNFVIYTSKLLTVLILLIFFLNHIGRKTINRFYPEEHVGINHQLKDLLIFTLILLASILFTICINRFLLRQQKRMSSLIDAVELLKGGNYANVLISTEEDEISRLALCLDELRRVLQKSNQQEQLQYERQIRLLTSISHDLRTPLTTLTGYLEILLDDENREREKQREYLTHCLDKAYQLEFLTSTAFEYFYLSEKEQERIELLRCNSFAKLNDIIRNSALYLQQNQFEYHMNLREHKLALVYDHRLLERLFDNVFTNIVRYGDVSVPVQIDTSCTDNHLYISIFNGISKNTHHVKGTGIGLKNCRRIMSIHKGTFRHEYEESRFKTVITLPIHN